MTDITTRELPRIRKALERIANGVERYADADPLTLLHEALQGADGDALASGPDHPLMPNVEPHGPISTNGFTAIYRLPGTDEWQIVARRHSLEESGYVVAIERA